MKLFEIIFILLLMIPVALLMRYFISKLSAQTPKQKKTNPSYADEKPSIKEWIHRKERELDEEYYEELEETEEPAAPPAAPMPQRQYRTHPEIKRTERVPFSTIYGDPDLKREVEIKEQASARSSRSTKKKRSEKQPSKRQKRKNRSRSRERARNRREKK